MCQCQGIEDGCPVFRVSFRAKQFANHRFARDPDEDGVVVVSITFQVAEESIVSLKALAEADAGVKENLLWAIAFQDAASVFEEFHDGLVDVALECILVHGLWGSDAMHHHVGNVVLADIRKHVGVKESSGDVVDDGGAFVDAGFCDGFPEGVDRDDDLRELPFKGFQHGDDPFHLFLLGSDAVVWPCGASAEVDDVGTLAEHLFTMLESCIHAVILSPVGERVGRDVEDAHDGREGKVHDEKCYFGAKIRLYLKKCYFCSFKLGLSRVFETNEAMKKAILILFLFVVWLGARAQTIGVKSFRALPTDMTASSRDGKRIDQNGEVAALIKVVTSERGFIFEGGALGIVETKQQTGEIWVWVPHGLRKITVKHQQLGVLRDYYFPLVIEPECTYEMVLATGRVETVVKDRVQMQYLVFQITPPNATLEVDDKIWEVDADGSSMKFVGFGTYSYRVQAPNYHTNTGSVVVDDPDNTKVVTVTLHPNVGWIEVGGEGNLQGASVYIDNVLLGKAPCKSDMLKSGSHTVRVVKEMYDSYSETVIVNDNETTRIAPVLKTDFAEITLTVDADAEIWVNNELKGVRSWTGPLSSGTYKIECKMEGRESTLTSQIINADMSGRTITLAAPRPFFGSLNVESSPNFCNLTIDGKDMGTTPKSISEIVVGEHELTLSKEGYLSHSETVKVFVGERTQVHVVMEKGESSPSDTLGVEAEAQQNNTVDKMRYFVLANGAYSIAPQLSCGITFGMVRKLGWYVNVNSNFKSVDRSYICSGFGIIDGLTNYSYTGEESTSRFSATVGMMCRLWSPVYVYFGGGYGWRNLYWEVEHYNLEWYGGEWAMNSDYSYQGVAIDGGLLLRFNKVGISLGVQTIGDVYMEVKLGLGVVL